MSGIFDENNKQTTRPSVEKLDMPANPSAGSEGDQVKLSPGTAGEKQINNAIGQINSAGLGGDSASNGGVSALEEKILEVTEAEEALAEQMLFNGYASKDVVIPVFARKGTHVTVTTITAQEMSLVNQMVFDYIREAENKDGNLDIPEIEIAAYRSALTACLTFRGINGKDLCENDAVATLYQLKAGIKKANSLLSSGNIEKGESLITSVKQKVRYRVSQFKDLPTPVTDFISDERYRFEQRMFEVMNKEAILPKS